MKGTDMTPHKDSKCGVCATSQFERNNYFYGKQFTVRDLLQEQSYFNDKRYLVNRMVLGWGVVCGLEVSWNKDKRKLEIGPGLALDCCGHEILVCDTKYLSFDDDDDDCCFEQDSKREGKFVLCLEYDECRAEPVDLPAAGCDETGKTEFNRIRDSYKLRLKSWDEACPREPRDEIDCPDNYKHNAEGSPDSPNCKTPTIHDYVCDRLKTCHECEPCDCVILATIEIEAAKEPQKDQYQKNNQQQGGYDKKPQEYKDPVVDSCTNRKFVYNNSLLYDLIYCNHGDLPHIVDFSWRKETYPGRQIGIDTFLKMMRDGLTVYFDQPMHADSLNRHTFIVSYLLRDTGTGAFVENRIPVQEIRTGQTGDCYTATFIATERWINKELDAEDSELIALLPSVDAGVDIEITLRGSRIWSTKGKGLDGDYLADNLPTGNGTQGGDFVDWFRVMPPDAKQPKGKSYKEQF
jgi:hypothetical protein